MFHMNPRTSWLVLFLSAIISLQTLAAQKKAIVFIDNLKQQFIETQASYYGRLAPRNLYKIYSPLEALVIKVKVQEGSKVKRGHVLATIKKNLINMDINPLEIRSPIDGFILNSKTLENTLVLKNQPLFTLYDGSNFQTTVHLSPDDADKLKIGDQINLNVSGINLKGKLNTLSEGIDPLTGTRSAQVWVKSKKGLRPGQLAKVIFTLERKKGYLISKKSLQKLPGGDYLNILEGNKVKQVKVLSKRRHNDLIEVWGKEINEKKVYIVKSSMNPLREGQSVTVSKQKSQTKKLAK